jgi:hypothetical protein
MGRSDDAGAIRWFPSAAANFGSGPSNWVSQKLDGKIAQPSAKADRQTLADTAETLASVSLDHADSMSELTVKIALQRIRNKINIRA